MLWTDLITPQELTGYARASLESYEVAKGTLARWLPNREVADIAVRFVAGQAGLVQEAKFRAYDAEPEFGKGPAGKRVTIELPAIGQKLAVSEYDQLRLRNAADETIRNAVLNSTAVVTQAVADAIERMRGVVLATGKATIAQANYAASDDFGRSASHTVTAGTLWSTAGADRLGYLQTLIDLYKADNGVDAGSFVMSTRVFRALQSGTQFATALANGSSRPATAAEVNSVVEGAGLPPITLYDRRTSAGRVTPDDTLFVLPAAVDPNGESELGATFWGQTLTSMDPTYGIEASEQPGVVAGVYKQEKPPMIAEVISDALALPVLANADLSIAAKVL